MYKKIMAMLICVLLLAVGIQITSAVSLNNKIQSNSNSQEDTEYWALLVAVGVYLNHPEQDRPSMLTVVEDIYDTLLSYFNWNSNHILKIKGEEATLNNIIAGLQWLVDKEDGNDVSLVYITTHGFPINMDLPPFDEDDGTDEALKPYEGFDNIYSNLVDDELNYYISALESKGVCVIIDSCYSGGFNDQPRTRSIETDNKEKDPVIRSFVDDFVREISGENRVVLMSSEEDEVSYGSFFSIYLNQGLEGAADHNHDGVVTAEDAFYYAKPRVEQIISVQHPSILDLYSGELPIVDNTLGENEGGDNQDHGIIYKIIQTLFNRFDNIKDLLLRFLKLPRI